MIDALTLLISTTQGKESAATPAPDTNIYMAYEDSDDLVGGEPLDLIIEEV